MRNLHFSRGTVLMLTFYNIISLGCMFGFGRSIDTNMSYALTSLFLAIAMQLRVYFVVYKIVKK